MGQRHLDLGSTDITLEERGNQITEWVEQHSDAMYSWASYKVSDDEVAKDLVQETFFSAIQSFESFQKKSSPKTWLFSILNNKIIDFYRKSLPAEKHSEENAVEVTNSMFAQNGDWSDNAIHKIWHNETNLLDQPEFNSIMGLCMDDLPSNWKSIVEAKFILEKESREICQEFEISTSNFWQIMHRAKLILKKCLEVNWFKK